MSKKVVFESHQLQSNKFMVSSGFPHVLPKDAVFGQLMTDKQSQILFSWAPKSLQMQL